MSRIRTLPLVLLLLCCLAWIAGCAPAPERPDKPDTELVRAQQLAEQGQYTEAAELYLAAAADVPAEKRDLMLLQAAEWYLAGEQYGQARGVIELIRRARLPRAETVRFDLTAAELALEQGAYAETLALLPVDAVAVPPALRPRFHRLRADALLHDGQPFASARERLQLSEWLSDPAKLHHNQERLFSALLRLSPKEMQRFLEPLPQNDPMRGWLALAYQMKTRLFEGQPMQEALRQWRERFPGHPAGEALAGEMVRRYRESFTYPDQVALLLPLSGRFSEAAEAIRNGFFAAWYEDAGERPALRVYDVSEHPQGVTGAYRQAVDDGAGWVVGPLEREHVESLLALPALPVPVLALNYAEQPLDTAAGRVGRAYQFGLLPEQEARQVAQRLMADGHRRTLVLAPRDEWGQRMMQAFVDEYLSLGGFLTEVSRYDPAEADHSDVLRQLLALDESQRRARVLEQLLGEKLAFVPQPRDDTDALFLAARPEQARLIRPQLRFFEAMDLPVYGTSHLYSGRPAPGSDSDLNGIVFCDAPWILGVAERGPDRQSLARLFPAAGGGMARLMAVGADAYRLIPFLDWLTDHPGDDYSGLSGALSLDESLRLHRKLAWAQFRGGRPVPLSPEAGRPENR